MGKLLIIKGADFSKVSIETVIPIIGVTIKAITLTPERGIVSGSGVYQVGDTVNIEAVALNGYKFSQWNDGVTTATRQIIVGQNDITYVAEFVIEPGTWLFGIDTTICNGNLAASATTGWMLANLEPLYGKHITKIKTHTASKEGYIDIIHGDASNVNSSTTIDVIASIPITNEYFNMSEAVILTDFIMPTTGYIGIRWSDASLTYFFFKDENTQLRPDRFYSSTILNEINQNGLNGLGIDFFGE